MSDKKSHFIKSYFYDLSDMLMNRLSAGEDLTVSVHGEHSEFTRFNQSKVRQATEVQQYNLSLSLVKHSKKIQRHLNITFDSDLDNKICAEGLEYCQKHIEQLPEFASVVSPTSGESSEQVVASAGLNSLKGIDEVLQPLAGHDMAGILTSGPIYKGVNNSKGQKHWFSNNNFYLDYSLYSAKQKAVTGCYAGTEWSADDYLQNLNTSKQLLKKMHLPVVAVPKGKHRVYLAPDAVNEISGMMAWNAFSMGELQRGKSPFQKLKQGEISLSKKMNVLESFDLGLSPKFNSFGEVSSQNIALISEGRLENLLTSSSTAKEYELTSNFANMNERPRSMVIQAGDIAREDILPELGTGIYISNLHYINWSDSMSARITGMTRFACLWVEDGEMKGPIKDLRFDESLYNCFGENLTALTSSPEVIPQTGSYSRRGIGGRSVPGIFVNDFNFTL